MSDSPPFVRGSDTSEAAAASITSDAVALRFRVFHYVRECGTAGATCWEVERDLNMRHQTAGARIRELVLLGGLADSRQRRVTDSGRKAAVWIATALIWKNDGMYWLAVGRPPPSLAEWPEVTDACELDGCEQPKLRGVPICRHHATMAPFELVQSVFTALRYPQAGANLLRYVSEARDVIEG